MGQTFQVLRKRNTSAVENSNLSRLQKIHATFEKKQWSFLNFDSPRKLWCTGGLISECVFQSKFVNWYLFIIPFLVKRLWCHSSPVTKLNLFLNLHHQNHGDTPSSLCSPQVSLSFLKAAPDPFHHLHHHTRRCISSTIFWKRKTSASDDGLLSSWAAELYNPLGNA